MLAQEQISNLPGDMWCCWDSLQYQLLPNWEAAVWSCQLFHRGCTTVAIGPNPMNLLSNSTTTYIIPDSQPTAGQQWKTKELDIVFKLILTRNRQ